MDCPHLNSKGEDNRLNNWKKWLTIRKNFYQKMYNIQKRTPSELVMNLAEDFVRKRNQQLLMEYCEIPPVTTDRGKPSFWFLPPALKKFPSLLSVMPKTMDNEIPERVLVNVAPAIKREKGVLTSNSVKESPWFKSKYLQKKTEEFQTEIKLIEPHYPEADKLIIFGESCSKEEITSKTVHLSRVKSDMSDLSELSGFSDVRRKSLQIENASFAADGDVQEVRKFHIFISYEIGKHEIAVKTICIKNTGTVTLRYNWKYKLDKVVMEEIIPHRIPECAFVFSKNEMILLPGQSSKIDIFFQTSIPGIYKEMWVLSTMPNVFTGKEHNGKFLLQLQACAEKADFAEAQEAILKRIDEGIKYSVIEDTLLDVLKKTNDKVCTKYAQIPHYNISERDLFEAANAQFGPPGTLPEIYFYDETIVKSLKKMYKNLRTNLDPDKWNYKLEVIDYVINNCPDFELRQKYRSDFDFLFKSLLKGNVIENEEQEKYSKIYALLCVMFDQISEKVYDLRDKFHIPYIEVFPRVNEATLLNYEYLNNNYKDTKFFLDYTVQSYFGNIEECSFQEFDKPQMTALMEMPFEDYEERFKVYFKEKYGISVDKGKGKKGKEAGKDNDTKTSKGAKDNKGKGKNKNGKAKDTAQKPSQIRKDFFLKDVPLTALLPNQVILASSTTPEDIQYPTENEVKMYQHNLYITVYSLLTEAIRAVEDFFDHFHKTKRTSKQILRNCIELGFPITYCHKKNKNIEREIEEILDEINSTPSFHSILPVVTEPEPESELSQESVAPSSSSYGYFFQTTQNTEEDIFVEMVDAGVTTSGEELYPPKTQNQNIQTDGDDSEFDLVAQIENELNSTSVQYFITPTADKATQKDYYSDFFIDLEEEFVME